MALELSADVFQRTSCCLSWCGEFEADYNEKPLISQEISGFYGRGGHFRCPSNKRTGLRPQEKSRLARLLRPLSKLFPYQFRML